METRSPVEQWANDTTGRSVLSFLPDDKVEPSIDILLAKIATMENNLRMNEETIRELEEAEAVMLLNNESLMKQNENYMASKVRVAALEAQLAMVSAIVNENIKPTYSQTSSCFDVCETVEDGYCIELDTEQVDGLRAILSTPPEVLAVVEGWTIADRCSFDQGRLAVSIYKRKVDGTESKVTAIIIAKQEGKP